MATTTFEWTRDELGPAKVVHLHDPDAGLAAMVVIDNVARGPSIGGVRMAPDVTTDEVFRLARAMTLKNAAAGLPHGGGKSGILADPRTADRQALLRAFGRAIRHLVDYIPGPDMGTDEACMAWLLDEMGRAAGLPEALGGIPLDEIGATGFGLAACADVAAAFAGLELEGARVAIEGYGNVGRPAARFLEARGAVLVAASDSRGAIHDAGGIDAEALAEAKRETGTVAAFAPDKQIEPDALFGVPCDILIPAARPDCIHAGNVDRIQARLILQGANIPATGEAEDRLHERGVISVPDFIANAGGVICAAIEVQGGSEAKALEVIGAKIPANTRAVLERSRAEGMRPRAAAEALARERVLAAMAARRR